MNVAAPPAGAPDYTKENWNMQQPPAYDDQHLYAQDSDYKKKSQFTSFEDNASTASTLAPSGGQKWNVRYQDWMARHGQITDVHTGVKIYEVEHRYRKPTFSLNNIQGQPIGTANSSKFTMRMEMSISGRDFELTPRHKISSDVSYVSPAFGGQTLTWEHGRSWTHVEYVLLDANAVPIAKFRGGSCWKCLPWGNFGDFEVFHGRTLTDAQRDEVIATGTTLAYRAAVNRSATSAAAISSSNAAAAAAA